MGFVAGVAVGLLFWLSINDLRLRRLPNSWVGVYALLFLPWAWGASLGPGDFGGHLIVAALGFLCLFALFATGVMAGGDVKLGTAVFLWSGPALAFPVVAVVAWTGGLIAVLGWLADRVAARWPGRTGGIAAGVLQALSARRGVPYGVALVAGGLYVLSRQAQQVGML